MKGYQQLVMKINYQSAKSSDTFSPKKFMQINQN